MEFRAAESMRIFPTRRKVELVYRALAMTFSIIVAPAMRAQQSPVPVARKTSSVVRIMVTRANGEVVTGNGVVAGAAERVLTERSILEGATDIQVKGPGSAPASRASVASVDSASGIAVLRVPGLSAAAAAISNRPMRVRDSVVVLTFADTSGTTPVPNAARVSAIKQFADGSLATISENIAPDANGTPVLNRAGDLVGVAFVTGGDGVDRTYVIPVVASTVHASSVASSLAPAAALTAEKSVPAPAIHATGKSASLAIVSNTREAPAKRASTAQSARLLVTGLQNATLLTHLYAGNFDAIALEPSTIEFQTLFQAYLLSCAVRCSESLPADRVQMQTLECVETSTPVNAYGAPVGTETCSRKDYKGTGFYADPRLYEAKIKSGQGSFQDDVQNAMKVLSQGFAAPLALAASLQTSRKDMDALLAMNGCASPTIKRFQENLRRFALGQQPLPTSESGGELRSPRVTTVDADFDRLLDDLISENATKWISNRYKERSASRVVVASRDAAGRPSHISGVYLFEGFDGLSRGTVEVEFSDGLPSCIYFFDAPDTCRKVPRTLVSAYAKGEYERGYSFASFKSDGLKTMRVNRDFYKACVVERVAVTQKLESYMNVSYWTPYCRCMERQYQPVLTDEEWLKFVNDYALFERTAVSEQEPRDWRLYEPQNACRH